MQSKLSASPTWLMLKDKRLPPAFHPIGCRADAVIPPALRTKLGPRVRPCVLVGYAVTTRASYRLLTLDTRKVIIRQNVKFDGDVFPLRPVPGRPKGHAQPPATVRPEPLAPAGPVMLPERKQHDPEPAEPRGEPNEPQEELGDPQEEPAPAVGLRRSGRLSSRPQSFSPCDYEAARQHRRLLADQALAAVIGQEPRLTPTTYAEAMECDARSGQPNWTNAIEEEIENMADNSAWEEAKAPPGMTIIPCMWLFKKKLGRDGEIARFRARCVAKGFLQRLGINYNDTFAPTLRMDSLRLMLVYCLSNKWDLQQYDVKGAFQIPELPPEEMVYMKPPPGVKVKPGYVLRLLKCIYGLKQSGRRWNQHFNATVTKMGFKVVDGEDCPYILMVNGRLLSLLAVYVDDILVGAISKEEGQRIAQSLRDAYTITELGVPAWLLGAEIDYNPTAGTLRISQKSYALQVLERFNHAQVNPSDLPAAPGVHLTPHTCTEEESRIMKRRPYRQIVGALMYLMVFTRPDLAFAVGQCARFCQSPGPAHWRALVLILRYVKKTADLGLVYRMGAMEITLKVDSSWADDPTERRSTGGWSGHALGAAFCWECKLLKGVALSSCESELMVLSRAAQQAVWLLKLCRALGIKAAPISIFEDNDAAIANVNGTKRTKRLKHVDIRYYFTKEQVKLGRIAVKAIASADNTADIFTKALRIVLFLRHRAGLGLE